MKTTKQLGIFMDHSDAHLMECFADNLITTKTIESKFTHQVKEETLERSEHIMHNKEQQQQTKFYEKLGDVIKDYDAVLLFGPTEAKVELYNILKADRAFDKIEIAIKEADKMTANQQQAFVKDYFELNKIITQ